nr:MAG TPA: hypothetical protein [Caudoviricetes sp.]
MVTLYLVAIFPSHWPFFHVTEVTDDTHHTYCGQKSGHLGVTRIVDFSLELQRKVTMWPFLVKYIYID